MTVSRNRSPLPGLNLKNLPAILADLTAQAASRKQRRGELIAALARENTSLARATAAYTACTQPMQREREELRASLEALDAKLEALRLEHGSVDFAANQRIAGMSAELRTDSEDEVGEFQREIDELRFEISLPASVQARQSVVLGTFAPEAPYFERARGVMELTLAAHRASANMAVTQEDVASGLARLRADLVKAGIGFLALT